MYIYVIYVYMYRGNMCYKSCSYLRKENISEEGKEGTPTGLRKMGRCTSSKGDAAWTTLSCDDASDTGVAPPSLD